MSDQGVRIPGVPSNRRRTSAPHALAGLLAVLAMVTGACSGAGSDVVGSYYQRVERLTRDVGDEILKLAPADVGRAADLLAGYAADLSALDPPDDAARVHNHLVAAARRYSEYASGEVGRGQTVRAALADASSPAVGAFLSAVCELQTLAAQNGSPVDLGCLTAPS